MKTSVIILSYNQEKYILDSLESIRSQTLQPDEIIISDDSSTDSTQQIIKKFVDEHNLKKWKIIFNKKNYGINKNLQNLIDLSSGDIIIPQPGDDIALPNRCETAYLLHNKYPEFDIITTSINIIDENNNIIGKLKYNDEIYNNTKETIIAGSPKIFPVGQTWKRTLFRKFGKIPDSVPNEDDQITFWGIIDKGIFCSKKTTCLYRIHSSSASSWLRNKTSDKIYFENFIQNMPVKRQHIVLWKAALDKVERTDKKHLIYMLNKKILIYNFLQNIIKYSIFKRFIFYLNNFRYIRIRESYYILFGKFGILSWRWLRVLLKRNKKI